VPHRSEEKLRHKGVFDRLSDVPDVLLRCGRGGAPLKLPTVKTYLDSYSFMTSVRYSYGQLGHSIPTSPCHSRDRLKRNSSVAVLWNSNSVIHSFFFRSS
jgi:hypothetical protein